MAEEGRLKQQMGVSATILLNGKLVSIQTMAKGRAPTISSGS